MQSLRSSESNRLAVLKNVGSPSALIFAHNEHALVLSQYPILARLKTIELPEDDLTFLSNRRRQILKPLITLSKAVSEDWYQRALRVARFFSEQQAEKTLSHKIPFAVYGFIERDVSGDTLRLLAQGRTDNGLPVTGSILGVENGGKAAFRVIQQRLCQHHRNPLLGSSERGVSFEMQKIGSVAFDAEDVF